MNAEIITIGDEILIGQVIDTNSAFISKALNNIGVSVYQITSIQDEEDHILQALDFAQRRVDLVIITGGLGPTKDDITKHSLCSFFNDELIESREVLHNIEYLFSKYFKRKPSLVNRQQALVPSKADVLMNLFGTAPGMWIEKEQTVFISLPGVPYEMKALMHNEVIPRLSTKFELPYIVHKTLVTYGMGESVIAEKIENWENALPKHIKLAYLPNLGKVRLRLSAKGTDKEQLEAEVVGLIKQLTPLIGTHIHGFEEDDVLEASIGKVLTDKGKTLAIAESCTGGLIAERITSIPGASSFFKGSVVTYATASKIDVLQVDAAIIEKHSVVSDVVARAMARGVQKLYKTDFAVATTGNAGPTKGDSEAEVGTVFIAIATPEKVFSKEFMLGNHRVKVVNKATNKAFELLLEEISKF